MNQKFKKGCITAILVFAFFFLFRLFYGYLSYSPETNSSLNILPSQTRESAHVKQNIASKKIRSEETGNTKSFDQKYEKVATLESLSSEIENDEKKIRDLINSSGSVIQYENSSGLKENRNRVLKLGVGVPPEKFDELVNEFKKIGKTLLLTIDKKDKTNEYKDLQSKKESLLKIRNSLSGLKNRGGRIDEFISLENRILEIEDAIQTLGISLGEFDSENEFCTVLIAIYENKSATAGNISFFHRVKVALEWAIKYYFVFSLSLLFAALSIHFGLPLLEKIKHLLIRKEES
ncbi:DUF4349 domain-containing protein [Leptospira sp. 201903070]|uniref:DUF4349 domain-containing protein n=1 Tax=Leptospira ainlahdjerensis TaxID=2810033 RepID=A0ABS2U802_9LEPT|nr:DUF4349 domain-containing protein [Leptospira ainlahdjerensis]MBM9575929.1 DUF4349 domain-containing protein [Leptospira ainlahdjerensis]